MLHSDVYYGAVTAQLPMLQKLPEAVGVTNNPNPNWSLSLPIETLSFEWLGPS